MESDRALIVDPLQAGGIPPEYIYKQIKEYFKGYPMCLYCPSDVHHVPKPNIKKLVSEDLPEFIGADYIRLHHGAREAAFTAIFALAKFYRKDRAPVVIFDGNTHYSMVLAAERAELSHILTEVENTIEKKLIIEDFEVKIEEVLRKYQKPPLAVVVNYPDGKYGNLPDIKKIAEIAHSYGTYLIADAAYSIGRMPFNMRELGVDIAIASAHKSMASIGPLGLLGMTEETFRIIARKSSYRNYKEVEFLGCTSRGLPTIVLLYVMDYLRSRVKKWEEKVRIARYAIEKFEKDLGFELQGEKPHNHDLLNFKTDVLYEISQKRRDRFFLYKYLKKHGIIGIKPGITKIIKLSTYLLSEEDVDYIVDVFGELIGDAIG